MKKIIVFFAVFFVSFSVLPMQSIQAYGNNVVHIGYKTALDSEGNAYLTVKADYWNYSTEKAPIRLNFKFFGIAAGKIAEVSETQRSECYKMERPDRVKFACNKNELGNRTSSDVSSDVSIVQVFKIDKSFVQKDKDFSFEVVFKDGIIDNEDLATGFNVNLPSLESPDVVIVPGKPTVEPMSLTAFAVSQIRLVSRVFGI